MKKNLKILFLLFLLIISCLITLQFTRPKISFIMSGNSFFLQINTQNNEQLIHPWYDETENLYYFFLPSYVDGENITLTSSVLGKLYFNNLPLENSTLNYSQDTDKIYTLITDTQNYLLKFICSQNIPSLFISSNGENFETIYENKDNFVTGYLTALDSHGNISYNGNLERLSGRGNSTWISYAKKPYSFKLETPSSLFGLTPSSKWILLANWRDSTKLCNKLALDMGHLLDMEYSPQSTWVDLYFDGSYMGNYLLCTPVSVNKYNVDIYDLEKENLALNPNLESSPAFSSTNKKGIDTINSKNITGGYLLEKEYELFYENEPSGFITNDGNHFIIKSPQHASQEQVDYISDYIQKIENLIITYDSKLQNYLDYNSYCRKCIIDEVSLNADGGETSCFFYKELNDSYIYSGPIWDYDSAFGIHSYFQNGKWLNYTTSLVDCSLTWNKYLYNTPAFFQVLQSNFTDFLPHLENLITKQIDIYAKTIKQSALMDRIRWKNFVYDGDSFFEGHYSSYDANVQYIKFFLTMRANHLIEEWNINYEPLKFPTSKQMHKVSFMINNTLIEEHMVENGTPILQLPSLDSTSYEGWYLLPRIEPYSQYLPILEDTIIIAK